MQWRTIQGDFRLFDEICDTVIIAKVRWNMASPLGFTLAGFGGIFPGTRDDIPAPFKE